MGGKVRLSGDATIERGKLPGRIKEELDEVLGRVADNPGAAGNPGAGRVDGVGIDGTRFHVEFAYEYEEDKGELFVKIIDVFSY